MRKILLGILCLGLIALIAARALLPEPVQSVMADVQGWGYNILDLDLPIVAETAGSALIAEMNSYYLFRIPTAKSAYTGLLSGKNLILICAENWCADMPADKEVAPTLYRLWAEGLRFDQVYRPDWYQGMDGREFALLSGMVPTSVNEETSFARMGMQEISLPYALAKSLTREGYDCFAFSQEEAHRAAYEALGFSTVEECAGASGAAPTETAEQYLGRDEPFFAYYVWGNADGEKALSGLIVALESAGELTDTVICLYMGSGEEARGHLILWAEELYGAKVNAPVSDLDVTPTLLNLLGVTYDSRFLSGRDALAQSDESAAVTSAMPLVSLYGSANSDWVTEAGSFKAADGVFRQSLDCFSGSEEVSAYVQAVNDLVYDRYVYARRVMENNYFQLALGFLDD